MRRGLLALLVLGLLVTGSGAAAYFYVNDPGAASGRPVKVVIEQGASGVSIANNLAEKGVVDSAFAFRLFMRTQGVTSNLRAGEYVLRERMGFADIVAVLKKGPAVKFVKLTIPEGSNIEQTAAIVGRVTHISAQDFLAAATPQTVRPKILPEDGTTLEGFLYPATYFVDEKETAASLVKRMVSEFDEKASDVSIDRATALGFTPYEVLVIASMIEEEAKAEEERTKISTVIHNRLRKNNPLGIDATIQYAVRKYEGQPLTLSDLAIDSPFNTRKFAGLPPTPISSPRASSIDAALEPERSDIFFYVLTEDCVHHFFTADANEFARAKARQPRNC